MRAVKLRERTVSVVPSSWVLKDLDSFIFADAPVDEGQVRELATGTFLDAKRNAVFIGSTATGKTHLSIASTIIRSRARGPVFNLVDLVNQLEQEKAASRTGRLAEKLLRFDLIRHDSCAVRRDVESPSASPICGDVWRVERWTTHIILEAAQPASDILSRIRTSGEPVSPGRLGRGLPLQISVGARVSPGWHSRAIG
ncbi:ATP-binding protein [Mesorhizobium sp. M0771]|uniref:ATP-binding protein n=1 Tax=Mesorhizobium sp. M0771 TaxID=2956997 RepID=UPI003339E588